MNKKQFTFIVLISIFMIIPTNGQDFYYGITGGMNIADMKILGDGEEQTVDPLNLWGFGGIFGVKMNENISFQLRPMYLQKGGTLIQDDESPVIDFNMSFLEIDLSVRASAGDQVKPYLLAGPSIGFLLNAESEFDFLGDTYTADVMDISKKVELSFSVGAGVEIPISMGSLFLDGRYVFGLNNLNKGGMIQFEIDGVLVNTEEIGEEDEYQNNGFQIMAGLTFPLRLK